MLGGVFPSLLELLNFSVGEFWQVPDESDDLPDFRLRVRRRKRGHSSHSDAVGDDPEELTVAYLLRTLHVEHRRGRVETFRKLLGVERARAVAIEPVFLVVREPGGGRREVARKRVCLL